MYSSRNRPRSASVASAAGRPAASAADCWKIHGLRRAPRPTSTPATPVCAVRSTTCRAVTQSPLPKTGIPTPAATVSISPQSDEPLYDCAAVRPCTATAAAPASSIMRASAGALMSRSSQPARILTVTGMRTARLIERMMAAACDGSRIRLQPALCFAIFGTGQPMFTSTMSAPSPSTMRAAAVMVAGLPPKI